MTLGDTSSEVFCTRFDPEDRYIACGYGDGATRIYNMETGKLSFTLSGSQFQMDHEMPVTCIRWRPQSKALKTMNVIVTAQADGSLKHWHATSGKCLHARNDDPDNHLYALDFNPDGSLLATAGRDCHIRIYDESTNQIDVQDAYNINENQVFKSLVLNMKEHGDFPGHSNRIFSVKFNQVQPNMVVSGGWDQTIQIYDLREKGPVASIYGPHICGDALDIRNDGVTLLTGSYRQDDALQLIDLRVNKISRTYEWDGLDGGQCFIDKENQLIESMPPVEEDEDSENMQRFKPKSPPMLYAAMFNRKQDLIFAGGAGRNQVRAFDYESGNLVCVISDMPRSVLCMDMAYTTPTFAFGSADSCVRIMDILSS